jgi:hypothetical protein
MLEVKKLELEKMKVLCAQSEMEYRILEHEENVTRLLSNIENQKNRIVEINALIKEIKER